MTIDLQAVIAIAIAYLLYTLALAAGVQTAINQIKPLFLDPIKAKLTEMDATTADSRYLIVIYVFRAIITALAYLYLWGGVNATRAILGSFGGSIPDAGIAIGTIALVVLGEEVIHPLVDKLYVLRDTAKLLGEINVTVPTSTVTDTSVSVESSPK